MTVSSDSPLSQERIATCLYPHGLEFWSGGVQLAGSRGSLGMSDGLLGASNLRLE